MRAQCRVEVCEPDPLSQRNAQLLEAGPARRKTGAHVIAAATQLAAVVRELMVRRKAAWGPLLSAVGTPRLECAIWSVHALFVAVQLLAAQLRRLKTCLNVPSSSMWGSVSNYLTYLTRSPRKSVAAVDLFAGVGALVVLGGCPASEASMVGAKVTHPPCAAPRRSHRRGRTH